MNLRTASGRARLHSVGNALQQIGVGQRQVDGDGDVVQRPEPRFHFHGEDEARHERSLLCLVVFVSAEGQLDVVLIPLQRVVVDDDLDFLSGLEIFRG